LSFFESEEKPRETLPQGKMTCALVIHARETEFARLLKIIETSFPGTQIVYKKVSIGKLWIMSGEPPKEEAEK
jgi:hypothetical protein